MADGLLFDVKDRNLDYTQSAIPVSKTNAATGFHTDSTAAEYYPDIVGLLCLQPASEGGYSQIKNAVDLYYWIKQYYPEDIKLLSEPIIRDIITPGTPSSFEQIKHNRFPVFDFDSSGFIFRYMKYWIITGYEKSGISLPKGLSQALNRVDSYLNSQEHMLMFKCELRAKHVSH